MISFLQPNKKLIFLFLLMFLLELIMIFALAQRNDFGIFSRSDGTEFQNIVKNLINRGIFSIDASEPFSPTNFRTPGYPFFLAVIYLIFSSFKPAIFIGAAIFALSAPITYLIGKEIFTEKIAFISAVLFAIEPWAIFQSGFLVAEQLFLPFFLLSAYFFCRYLKSAKAPYLYSTLLFLGITVLIRPLAVFFILIFIFLIFLFEFKHSYKRALKMTFLSIVIFTAVLSPWLIRNKIILNTWQISSISNVSLYVENYEMLQRYLGKMKPNEDINERGRMFLGTENYGEAKKFKNSKILAGEAVKEIRAHLGSYIAMHLKKLPLFLTKNSYGNIFFDLKTPMADIQSNMARKISNHEFEDIFITIKNAPISSKILIAGALFWPLVVLLAILGVIAGFKIYQKNLLFWFFILWMAYFLILTGNLRDISRYKLNIHLPLFTLAVFGFYKISSYFFSNDSQ